MKYWLILLLLASTILTPVFYRPNSNAQAAPPQFVEIQREENSKKYQNGNHFIIDASIAPVHYQDSQGQWQEINTRLTPALAPWDWQMIQAGYNFNVKSDFTAGQIIDYSTEGQHVFFQPMTLKWTNNLSQIQQIGIPQNVTPTITNTPSEILPGVASQQGSIEWPNAYGSGIDFTYSAYPAMLNKLLTVSGLNDLPPPPAFILSGGNPSLTLDFIFDPDASLFIWVDGNLWNERDKTTTSGPVLFKNGAAETLFEFTPPVYWDSAGNGGSANLTLDKIGNSLYVSVSVPYSWLQTAAYPVYIDPTIDVGISVSTDDVHELESDGSITDQTGSTPYAYTYAGLASSGRYWGAFRFPGVAIDQGSTIDVSYVSGQVHDAARDYIDANIHFLTNASPNTFSTTNATDVTGRPRTTASVSWINADLGAPTTYQTPSLNTPLQEVVNSVTTTAVAVVYRPNSDGNFPCRFDAYNYAGGGPAAIHIEYTAGGGASAPTVVTNAAQSVEETTANVSGNITATGGENASHVYFYYDTNSGAPYASSVNASGSYGVGEFSFGLTGLTPGQIYYGHASANNSGGTGNGTETSWLMKPNPATSFQSTGNGTTWISSSWTNGTGTGYVEVRYLSGAVAPSDNTSGTLGFWGTTDTTANITGLSSGNQYTFRIFTHANSGALWSTADGSVTFTDWTDNATVITAPTLVTANASSISYFSVTGEGNITATGGENATERGFQYGIGDFSSNVSQSGSYSTGNFTIPISGLSDNTEYQYRAYAINSAGIGYGSSVNFTTLDALPPTVVTGNASSVSYTSVTGEGNITVITGENATQRGFQYGIGGFTSNISESGAFSTGNFTLAISGLLDNTEYQYRAFALNTQGIGYGATVNFTTLDIVAPTVVTINATSITSSTATLSGNVTSTGGPNYGTRFVQWGTSSGNYTSNSTASGSYTIGVFNIGITGLSANTTYYFRAGAINNGNVGYGMEATFATSAAPSTAPSAPTNFTVTDLGGITATANWTASSNTTGYVIWISRTEYPDDTTSFEVAYNGTDTSVNLTGLAMGNTLYYLSLRAYNEVGYSSYAAATVGTALDTSSFIEDADMQQVATSIDGLAAYGAIFLLILILVLALKLDDFVLYIGAGIIEFLLSSTLIDTYAGIAVTGATIGIALGCKGVLQALQAGGASKGWSQIKGYYESIKEKF